MTSKTFFFKLKETCRKIDNDVNDIKMKMIGTHKDHDNEEAASKKICEIQDKINIMKTESSDLKNMLGPKLADTRNFIKNLKELITETEMSVSTKEEYLKQYGYTPAESTSQAPEITVENCTPDKKAKEDSPVTPNLLDYGIPSYDLVSTPNLDQKFCLENSPLPPVLESSKPTNSKSNSDSTPTLDVKEVISNSKPKETPPFPEQVLYTPAKETPPMPGPIVCSSSEFPSTPKLII